MHKSIASIVNISYKLSSKNILKYANSSPAIKHEMSLETGVIDLLSNSTSILGKGDYISHQVIASPFKPMDYMDKMDIFCYRHIKGFDIISKYCVIELKKDKCTKESIQQIMKYVDWVNQEYAYGDYAMIEAYLICSDFSAEIIAYKDAVCTRSLKVQDLLFLLHGTI